MTSILEPAQISTPSAAPKATTNYAITVLPTIVVSSDPIDGVKLLGETQKFLTRFVTMPRYGEIILPVWAGHTYVFQLFRFSPYLHTSAPGSSCGKSTLADSLFQVSHNPLLTDNSTGPAIYRYIDLAKLAKDRPTLFLDEFDSQERDITNILNSGFKHSGGVLRCDGDDKKPRLFPTYCPKAIFGIALTKLKPALRTRTLAIKLKKVPDVEREDFTNYVSGKSLQERWALWAFQNEARLIELAKNPKDIAAGFNGRARDIAVPLLAVADVCGGDWPRQVREALHEVFGFEGNEGDSQSEMVLRDTEVVFKLHGKDRIASNAMLSALNEMEDRPWGERNHGKGLNSRQLNELLQPFDIHSTDMRDGELKFKGFDRKWFLDAYAAHLSPKL